MNKKTIQFRNGTGHLLAGLILKASPKGSRAERLGYSFTADLDEAWTFETVGEAARKQKVLARHFQCDLDDLEIKVVFDRPAQSLHSRDSVRGPSARDQDLVPAQRIDH